MFCIQPSPAWSVCLHGHSPCTRTHARSRAPTRLPGSKQTNIRAWAHKRNLKAHLRTSATHIATQLEPLLSFSTTLSIISEFSACNDSPCLLLPLQCMTLCTILCVRRLKLPPELTCLCQPPHLMLPSTIVSKKQHRNVPSDTSSSSSVGTNKTRAHTP